MKKQRTSIIALTLVGVLGVTTLAAGVKTITADLRPDVTVRIDGVEQTMVDTNGNIVHPVTYEGTTYLPIRAIGNLMDYDVSWDSKSQSVILDRKTATKPEDITLEKLTTRTADTEKSVTALVPAATYAQRMEQYTLHSRTIQTLRQDVAELDKKVESQFFLGTISTLDYNVTIKKVGDLDARLKTALETLESKTIANEDGKRTVFQETQAELDDLMARVQAQEKAVAALTPAKTQADRTEQYNKLSPELTRLGRDLRALDAAISEHLRLGRVTYGEYNTLDDRCDNLEDRVEDGWDALRDKTLDWTQETKPEGGKTYDGYVKTIDGLSKQADQLAKDVENYKPANNDNSNKQAYRNLMDRIQKLEREMDTQDDNLERDYRAGTLTAAQYRELDRLLDRAEDKVDNLDDRLENKSGRWDDDDHDDDWDDDHDDDWDD